MTWKNNIEYIIKAIINCMLVYIIIKLKITIINAKSDPSTLQSLLHYFHPSDQTSIDEFLHPNKPRGIAKISQLSTYVEHRHSIGKLLGRLCIKTDEHVANRVSGAAENLRLFLRQVRLIRGQ